MIYVSASSPFLLGATIVFDDALTQRYGSDLLTLRLHFAHKSAVSFVTSPTFWKFEEPCLTQFLPGSSAHFVSSFDAFRLADFVLQNRQSRSLRAGAQ
jgi:hypothetical protein